MHLGQNLCPNYCKPLSDENHMPPFSVVVVNQLFLSPYRFQLDRQPMVAWDPILHKTRYFVTTHFVKQQQRKKERKKERTGFRYCMENEQLVHL